jgi:DNA topoisomerase-6 subunit B
MEDNAGGILPKNIPDAFGRVLVSSKYKLRQTRGLFGLGGKMALIYSQSTTHEPFIISSTNSPKSPIIEYTMLIEIKENRPRILKRRKLANPKGWQGLIVELTTRGDWSHAKPKILEYLNNSAIAAPYARIVFKDPDGAEQTFEPSSKTMPKIPTETKPHPLGLDLETLKRMTLNTKAPQLASFLTRQFQRVGPITAKLLLQSAGLHPRKNPQKLTREELLQLSTAMNNFEGFKAPQASGLSPIGGEQLKLSIKKQLQADFAVTSTRKPSSYSGFPFIVETALAYGGKIQPADKKVPLIRFANKIPLLFDEGSDVSRQVVDQVNWHQYRVDEKAPITVVTSIVSTRIPWRSAGKEIVAERPEIERELLNSVRDCARQLSKFLSRRQKLAYEKRRVGVFEQYLPRLAAFATKLAREEKVPDIKPLLRQAAKYTQDEPDIKSPDEE